MNRDVTLRLIKYKLCNQIKVLNGLSYVLESHICCFKPQFQQKTQAKQTRNLR